MILVILTIAFNFSIGWVERLLPHAASALPKVVIFNCTTPVCVQTMFKSEPSATTA